MKLKLRRFRDKRLFIKKITYILFFPSYVAQFDALKGFTSYCSYYM